MPLCDIAQIVILLPILIVTLSLQDTLIANYALMILLVISHSALNILGVFAFAFRPYAYICYMLFRSLTLAVFMLGWLASYILTTYAISQSAIFDDPKYGLCCYCTSLKSCESDY